MVSLLTIPQRDCIISPVLTRAAMITTSSMARVSPCKRTTHEQPYLPLKGKQKHQNYTTPLHTNTSIIFCTFSLSADEMMTNTARTLHSLRRYRIQKIISSQQPTLFTHSAFINTSAYTPPPPSHPRLGRNPSRCRRCRRPPPSSPGRPACAPPPAGTPPRNPPSRRCTSPALSKS